MLPQACLLQANQSSKSCGITRQSLHTLSIRIRNCSALTVSLQTPGIVLGLSTEVNKTSPTPQRRKCGGGHNCHGCGVLAHPLCCPPWLGPLPEACWSPVACIAERGSQAGWWREGQRLQSCWWANTPSPTLAPGLRTAGRGWAQERWETRHLHRALSPGPNRRAQADPHHPGKGPSRPPRGVHS